MTKSQFIKEMALKWGKIGCIAKFCSATSKVVEQKFLKIVDLVGLDTKFTFLDQF
jgi:hypothetical protein